MGNRRIILFLLCGIAVCSALLWGVPPRSRVFRPQEKTRASLLEGTLDTVERITIDRGDARIGLSRESGKWLMTAPFHAQVEQGEVARLLDAFESAPVQDALPFPEIRKRELSLSEFGLAPARMQVVLERGGRHDVFLFGAATPTGNEVFMRVNDKHHILVVDAALMKAIPATADDIRSRKLINGNRNRAHTLEVRSPGTPFITLSRDTGTWLLTQPVAAPASDERVDALLDMLYNMRINAFVWPTVSNVMDVAEAESVVKTRMDLYGLGADTGLQIFVQESGGAQPVKLTFGTPLKGDPALSYVLLPGGEAIGTVSNAIARAFLLTAAGLRDPRPFSGSAAGVRQLAIHLGSDTPYMLAQTNAVWRFQAPVSDEADQAAVRDTLEQLMRLKADSLSDTTTEQKEHDIERGPPISRVEVVSDQGSWQFTVESDTVAGDFLSLTFTNTPTVFRVASSNVPPALTSVNGLMALRGKTVLSLPRTSLRRITIKRNGTLVAAIERDTGASAWRAGSGTPGRLAIDKANALAVGLAQLQADRIEAVGIHPDRFAQYGLDKPWLEISVDVDAKDAVRKVLLVGKDAGFGKRYATVRGQDTLFILAPDTLTMLAERIVDPVE